jgi:uncharacterized protein YndB with AHSA1/START domain
VAEAGEELVQGSFHLEQEVEIAVPRERLWECLVDVGGWWLYREKKGKASEILLEPRVGGRFYERFAGGEDGSLWGVVTYLERPEVLRLCGFLGMQSPATNLYEYRLEARGERTLLRLSHRAFGLMSPGARADYQGGWKGLWESLRAFAERGERRR